MLFVGLFLALLCQVGLSPSAGLPVLSESGSGSESHGMAMCPQSLMIAPAYLLAYFCLITPVAAVAPDKPAQEHTLPCYQPPRPTA